MSKKVESRKVKFPAIGVDNFESEVLQEEKPVLLACLHQGLEFYDQVRVLESVGSEGNLSLKVCLLDEEYFGAFGKKFSMAGTPTYFVFHKGVEKGRLLGRVDRKTLNDFVIRTLSEHLRNYPYE
ncbi:MAG: hypothetical protein V2A69_07025 [Pseudomonadota bacterium]